MCALVLRSSSDAQRASASWTAGSAWMSRLLLLDINWYPLPTQGGLTAGDRPKVRLGAVRSER
jgi:hypothetical protein